MIQLTVNQLVDSLSTWSSPSFHNVVKVDDLVDSLSTSWQYVNLVINFFSWSR